MLVIYYSLSGVTRSVAERIQAKTGAELLEIKTVKQYSANYNTLIEEAKKELQEYNLPELSTPVPQLASHDMILMGTPVWWYTLATPVMKFLEQADFAGRQAAMFCTHGGGPGHTLADFAKQAKNAKTLPGMEFYNPKADKIDKALDAWLAKFK